MTSRSSQSWHRSRTLQVEPLEDRIAPVIGNGAAPPALIAAGGGLDHVVQIRTASGSIGSGALLDTQRHILTAAHVIDPTQQTSIRFDMARNRGGGIVQIPITFSLAADPAARWQIRHPAYMPPIPLVSEAAANDIGIYRLTDGVNPAPDRYVIAPVGPNNLRGYTIANVNPVGQVATIVGYGETGIGDWGESSDAVQVIQITNIPGAGGKFTLSFTPPGGGPAQTTANINTNGLKAAGLAAALEALPALTPKPGVDGNAARRVEVSEMPAPPGGNAVDFAIRFVGPDIGRRAIALMGANVPYFPHLSMAISLNIF